MSAPADLAQAACDRLTAHYRMVAETRMAGLPICNPALSVAAIGFDRVLGAERLGVLLTPWFMSAILLPEAPTRATVGAKRHVQLPAGRFAFVAHDEPGLGVFWSCSLLSPVFELGDQPAALGAAEAALATLLAAGDLPEEDERAIAAAWHGQPDQPRAAAADAAEGNPARTDPADTDPPEARPRAPLERASPTRREMFTLGRRAGA